MFSVLYTRYKPLFISNWGVLVGLALLTFFVFSGIFLFGHTTFLTNLDNVDQTYTWYQKLATSWHHGYLPVWNANTYSGSSFAGELQTGVFYPLNWLWVAVFGSASGIPALAINYLVALHFLLAAFGCYLLLRELRAKQWAALLGGITFAFSGALAFRAISQTVIFFGLAFIPYVLYFWARYLHDARARKRWLVLSGVFLGATLLVGHIQPFFHATLAVLLLQATYLYKNHTWRKLGGPLLLSARNVMIMLGAAAFVALPQLWVSASYLPHAYRIQAVGYAAPGEKIGYGPFSKAFNLDLHEFANLIDPVSYPIRDGNNIFIGLAPLSVIVIGLCLARIQFKKTDFWLRYGSFANILLVCSILAMLGYVTWFAVVLYELPFVYQIRQLGRYAVLFDLALILVLAGSLETFVEVRLTQKQRRALLAAGLFLMIESLYVFLLRKHVFGLHFALQIGLASCTILLLPVVASARIRRMALAGIVLATAGVNTLWYLPKIQPDTETAAHYNLPIELKQILERTNGQYRVEDVDGALPLNVGNVYNVQTTGGYSATIYDNYYQLRHKSTIDPDLIRDVLGVELLASKEVPKNGELQYSDTRQDVYIVRRGSVLPKAFVADKPGSVDRKNYHGLLVSTKVYDDRHQQFEIQLDKPQRVILSELWYPGWAAKVDNQTASLYQYSLGGYPLLKSLDVPAGTHTIKLTYKPFIFF